MGLSITTEGELHEVLRGRDHHGDVCPREEEHLVIMFADGVGGPLVTTCLLPHIGVVKKMCSACFIVLCGARFVYCGFGTCASKKREAKQGKQGDKEAKQAK